MDDQKIIKLLWQRAESAIEALAKKLGNRLMSIAMNCHRSEDVPCAEQFD